MKLVGEKTGCTQVNNGEVKPKLFKQKIKRDEDVKA